MPDPADVLARIAFGLQFTGQSSRRVAAYRSGARTLRKLGGDVARMHRRGELDELDGIGSRIVAIVGCALGDEQVPELQQLQAQIPSGVWEMRDVRGLGPKTIRQLHDQLGVGSLAELEYACHENRLAGLTRISHQTSAATFGWAGATSACSLPPTCDVRPVRLGRLRSAPRSYHLPLRGFARTLVRNAG